MMRHGNGIAIITVPFAKGEASRARHGDFEHLTTLFHEFTDQVIVISGNLTQEMTQKQDITVRDINKPFETKLLPLRIVGHIVYQLRVSIQLIRLRNRLQIAFFHFGGTFLLLPLLTARLLRLRSMISVTGAVSKGHRLAYQSWNRSILAFIMSVVEHIAFILADRIIVFSEKMITFAGIQKYQAKISIADYNYVDTSVFRITTPVTERPAIVAFVGRIGKVKGVINFARAIPMVLAERDDVSFYVIGDGTERATLENELALKKVEHRVTITGWVTQNELVKLLNHVQLVVLPSVSEGLPKLIPEAMACGTPILATPVGSIPDLIKDEKTGFIMEDNSPECIARNVLKVLQYPGLESIAKQGILFVEQYYHYEQVKDKYRKALNASPVQKLVE